VEVTQPTLEFANEYANNVKELLFCLLSWLPTSFLYGSGRNTLESCKSGIKPSVSRILIKANRQAAWALGTCIGPVLGGVFVERSTWRWIFYLMFPFCFLGFCTIPWLLTLRPRTDTFLGKLKRVDWIGGILFTSSSAAFLVAISWGGSQYAWDSYQTLLPLCLGVFGILLTVAWERIRATDAFLRRSLFHCTSSFCAYAGAATQGYLVSFRRRRCSRDES